MTKTLPVLLLLLLLAAGALGCHDETMAPPLVFEGTDEVRKGIGPARTAWEQRGPSSYTLVFHWSCFCPPEMVDRARITVENDIIVAAAYVETNAPVSANILAGYRTVDGLFDLIQDALDSGADGARAEFDADLGFPRTVFIDYELGAADEELGFELLSVTPLP